MLVRVVWQGERQGENFYEASYAAYFDDKSDKGGPCVVILATIDGDERKIYLCGVKRVEIWHGGKVVRHFQGIYTPAVEEDS